VVNLTGNGNTARRMEWPEAAMHTELNPVERNLESESADEVLAGIESRRWSRCLLPWVPLMAGADNPTVVDRWKKLAEAEPSSQRKAEFGGIAILFAGRVGRKDLWQDKLKGWNMEESTVVQEWVAMGEARGHAVGKAEGRAEGIAAGKAEGRAEGRAEANRDLILSLGAERFGLAPATIEAALKAIADGLRLERIARRVMGATDWNDLLATP
jgi:hypothetical protein